MNKGQGFWRDLKFPIFVQAPMADVTDAAFRRMIARHGKPDVLMTEFVSCDGLCSEGRPRLMRDLIFDESERPIVAQLFGSKPETFYQSAQWMQELGFDGIDINMGCPDRRVCKNGAGAALINNPNLAKAIVRASQQGAGPLPVSVKTRMGYHHDTLEEWIGHLLESRPAAITIHLRTRKEMSRVAAHWDRIIPAVQMARETETLILGNGDVEDLDDAKRKVETYGVDGVMLGRGIYGNPWLYNKEISRGDLSREEKLATMITHAELYDDIFKGQKHFAVMRKHFKAYVTGFPGAKELRAQLEQVQCTQDVKDIVRVFQYQGRDFKT